MKEVLFELHKVFDLFLQTFITLESRVSLWYLLPTVLIAYIVHKTSCKNTSFLFYLFNKKVWLSKSARIDYYLLIINLFVKVFLVFPYLSFGLYLSFYFEDFLQVNFGLIPFTLSKNEVIIYYTLFFTFLNDLGTYLLHLMFHKLPFLWVFHKTHHSATVLNPISQYRIHPVELIFINIKETIVFGFCMGIANYFTNYSVSFLTFLGVNVFTFFFFFFGASLRHSMVKFSYFPWLENILLSPYQHQIHHSNHPAHYNKNLGSKFAVWDKLFGTLLKSRDVTSLKLGISLNYLEIKQYSTLLGNLFYPFLNLFKINLNKFWRF